MAMASLNRRCPPALLIALGLLLWAAGPARAQLTEPLNLQAMVDRADQIVLGNCTERRTAVEDGLIVTHYKVKPAEFWKGQRTLSPQGDFTMTEIGGELENSPVPLAQFAPGGSDMLPGEDVLLFLSDPKPPVRPSKSPARKTSAKPANSSLNASPMVVGRWQGRFSVVTNPRTGKKTVAHTNVSPVPGSPLNNVMREKLLHAQGFKPTRNAKGARVAVKDGSVALTGEKLLAISNQLDRAEQAARRDHEELAKKTPAAADEIFQFESVDAVKARVLRLAHGAKK